MKRNIILAIIAIALIGGVYGLYQFNKKVPTLESATPDFQLTANQLYNAFDKNESEATGKFQEKVIEVTGTVFRTKSDTTQLNIILKAENSMTGGVNCSLRDLDAQVPEKGSQVTLKGKCQGFLMDVVLNNCVVVK